MKTILKCLSMASLVALVPGCVIDNTFDCKHGRGEVTTETFVLDDFSEVRLRMDATVYVTQGDSREVTLIAQSNIADEIEFKIRGDELIIDNDRCLRNFAEIEIFLTMDRIRALSLSGSGAIISENVLEVNDLDLNVSGSGTLDLAIEADDVHADLSGSGDIRLEGVANDLRYRVSGSGDLHAFGLITQTADITISGSGDAEVFVEEFLDVRISGSGDVYYKGDPRIESKTSGSGRVHDAN